MYNCVGNVYVMNKFEEIEGRKKQLEADFLTLLERQAQIQADILIDTDCECKEILPEGCTIKGYIKYAFISGACYILRDAAIENGNKFDSILENLRSKREKNTGNNEVLVDDLNFPSRIIRDE